MSGLIFHIPHSSTFIPDAYRPDFCLSDHDLSEEIRLMTDWHTADLFRPSVDALGIAVELGNSLAEELDRTVQEMRALA